MAPARWRSQHPIASLPRMHARFPVLAALLLVVVGAAAGVRAETGGNTPLDVGVGFGGPLGSVQVHPFRQALVEVPARGSVGRPWLRIERNTANVWNAATPLVLERGGRAVHMADLQQDTLLFDVGMPVGDWLAVGVRGGQARLWGGGFVDQMIEDFHHTFDFYNFDRHKAPIARTELRMETPDGRSFAWLGARGLLLSPLLSAFLRLVENRTTRVLVRADMLLPLGDVARALNLSADVALGVSVWQRVRSFGAYHIGFATLLHGTPRVGGLQPNRPRMQGEVSLELRVLPRMTILVEDKLQSPVYRSGAKLIVPRPLSYRATAWNGYFTPVNIISGGARVYLPSDTVVTVFVGEDFMLCVACSNTRFSRETNSPDVSLTITVEQLFATPRL